MPIEKAFEPTLSTADDEIQLSTISPRDKPWDTHRANSDRVKRLFKGTDLERYAQRIQECSQSLNFAPVSDDEGSLRLKLQSAHFCRVRQCPVCQWRRSLMWRARFFQAVPKILGAYPKARFIFLTLTVRNCPVAHLRATLKDMNKAWERLSKRKVFPAFGWVKSVEVTRGHDGSAHPHFHALLVVNESYFKKGYLSQATWTELWQRSLRVDYTPVVNVKAVKARPGREGEVGQDITAGVLETLKYGVKESDLIANREWLLEMTVQLHKTRAVAVGGVLRDFIREEEPEDLIHEEDAETEEDAELSQIRFGWRERFGHYLYESQD